MIRTVGIVSSFAVSSFSRFNRFPKSDVPHFFLIFDVLNSTDRDWDCFSFDCTEKKKVARLLILHLNPILDDDDDDNEARVRVTGMMISSFYIPCIL